MLTVKLWYRRAAFAVEHGPRRVHRLGVTRFTTARLTTTGPIRTPGAAIAGSCSFSLIV